MDWQEHIHSDPTVSLGKPTIKGTRLSVELILELFELGWTKDKILESYPKLSDSSIKAVFAYLKNCLRGKSYSDIEENELSQAHESAVIYGSKKEEKKPFNPDDFLGIMSYPIEFLDSEIKNMRNEWDRDI